MLALSFGFLAGRYHATPWGNQVNEGVVEWPPSPWRILRACVAASYKLRPRLDPIRVMSALAPLRALPVYALPPVGTGHTRHYMPAPGPTKIFDTFVAPEGELIVAWPDVQVAAAELADLDRILEAIGYLGRAESWIEVKRLEDWQGRATAVPRHDAGPPSPRDVRLQALLPEKAYAEWLEQQPKAKSSRLRPPETWWDVLHQDTGKLFAAGWSRPPGTRDVIYALEVASYPKRGQRKDPAQAFRPTVARFALVSAVPPRITETLTVGERARQALLARSNGLPIFAGKDADAVPLKGHRHAYFLPVDDDADGLIDHLVVSARDGFDTAARSSLERLRRLWGHGGHDIALTLIGLGQPKDFGGPAARGGSPSLGRSALWVSRTPFILPRHAKRRGGTVRNGPEQQLRRCLQEVGLPEPTNVEVLDDSPQRNRWWRFRRQRLGGGGNCGSHDGYGFRFRFAEAFDGPIAVGYGAHMGLGQFVPED